MHEVKRHRREHEHAERCCRAIGETRNQNERSDESEDCPRLQSGKRPAQALETKQAKSDRHRRKRQLAAIEPPARRQRIVDALELEVLPPNQWTAMRRAKSIERSS